jgi:hypothetical protein
MKDVILNYFLVLRGIFDFFENVQDEEIKQQAMLLNKSFNVDYISVEVARKTSDPELIDEITCFIIYDLIANSVLLPAQRIT